MKNSPRMLLLFAFFVVGGAHHLFAQAPANNNCANATLLGPAATCVPTAGTTQNATYTNAAGDCGGNQPDVWYRFVATSTEHQVRMDGGLYFDGVIGALTSCGSTGRPTGGDCVDYSGSDGVEILNLSGLTMGLSDRCIDHLQAARYGPSEATVGIMPATTAWRY